MMTQAQKRQNPLPEIALEYASSIQEDENIEIIDLTGDIGSVRLGDSHNVMMVMNNNSDGNGDKEEAIPSKKERTAAKMKNKLRTKKGDWKTSEKIQMIMEDLVNTNTLLMATMYLRWNQEKLTELNGKTWWIRKHGKGFKS